MNETRKLAAILAADVVGYSRLASADEDRTLARLRALRSDLIDPTIAVHNGRVVKRTGDGALVEFRSVVDAVRCAIEVQNGMVERNAGLPQDRRIEFRIGIHLGDVVEESDGDLMGDGVNIAARWKASRSPGHLPVRGRLSPGQGEARPLRQRSRHTPSSRTSPSRSGSIRWKSALPRRRSLRRKTNPLNQTAFGTACVADKPSIAVLPFTNMSGDPEQEYFADGITEDIITELSRFRSCS